MVSVGSEVGHQGTGTGETRGGPRFAVDARTAVFTETLERVEPGSGTVGRLAKTGHIPLGYYKDEEKTAKTFVTIDGTRWVLPGDMATIEADGAITLYGRDSVCINSGGEKIFTEEVEAAVKSHDKVFDAIIVGVPDERFGQRVAAVVQARDGAGIELDELKDYCRSKVAGYKVPRELHLVDTIQRQPAASPTIAGRGRSLWARPDGAAMASVKKAGKARPRAASKTSGTGGTGGTGGARGLTSVGKPGPGRPVFRPRKALVTGASGLIGSHLVRILVEEGVEVRAMVQRGAPLHNLRDLDIELVEGELLDESTLAAPLRDRDTLFHLRRDLPDLAARAGAHVPRERGGHGAAARRGAPGGSGAGGAHQLHRRGRLPPRRAVGRRGDALQRLGRRRRLRPQQVHERARGGPHVHRGPRRRRRQPRASPSAPGTSRRLRPGRSCAPTWKARTTLVPGRSELRQRERRRARALARGAPRSARRALHPGGHNVTWKEFAELVCREGGLAPPVGPVSTDLLARIGGSTSGSQTT